MADPYYRNLEQQLRTTKDRVRQSFDRPNDPMARSIYNEIQKAEDMAQNSHNLRSIEDRLKSAQRLFQQSQRSQPSERIMNPEHSEHFHDHLDDIRNDIRRQSQY